MNKRRLLKLADLLEKDAKNKKGIFFDLSVWGWVGNEEEPLSCGTTACAMGLAAISGAFKRQGLRCRFDEGGGIRIGFGRRWDALLAARRLFGITDSEARQLFLYSGDIAKIRGAAGERAVARRIRDFVSAA
jgi:hypothetical protein